MNNLFLKCYKVRIQFCNKYKCYKYIAHIIQK
jgi:hypothetical protein